MIFSPALSREGLGCQADTTQTPPIRAESTHLFCFGGVWVIYLP